MSPDRSEKEAARSRAPPPLETSQKKTDAGRLPKMIVARRAHRLLRRLLVPSDALRRSLSDEDLRRSLGAKEIEELEISLKSHLQEKVSLKEHCYGLLEHLVESGIAAAARGSIIGGRKKVPSRADPEEETHSTAICTHDEEARRAAMSALDEMAADFVDSPLPRFRVYELLALPFIDGGQAAEARENGSTIPWDSGQSLTDESSACLPLDRKSVAHWRRLLENLSGDQAIRSIAIRLAALMARRYTDSPLETRPPDGTAVGEAPLEPVQIWTEVAAFLALADTDGSGVVDGRMNMVRRDAISPYEVYLYYEQSPAAKSERAWSTGPPKAPRVTWHAAPW